MIRYRFIENQIFKLYYNLPNLSFPIQPSEIIKLIPNCRYMTYKQFAEMNCCSVNYVAKICQSDSGCCHFDSVNNRYLIIYNDNTSYGNTLGRQRWTFAHEIGHVVLNHFPIAAKELLAEDRYDPYYDNIFEHEADFFASTLLSPLALFPVFDIKSAHDARWKFGLSKTAAENRFQAYQRWQNRYHNVFDRDIVRLYHYKNGMWIKEQFYSRFFSIYSGIT